MKKYVGYAIAGIATVVIALSFTNKEPENKAELGKLLFFDPILSKDKTISCASCHKPDFAFADTSAVSRGVGGKRGTRNSPTAMNVMLRRPFFWDGRARTLEEQALAPIENPVEMNLHLDSAIQRLRDSRIYNDYFRKLFDSEPTRENLAAAIAAFERTLETSNSPFDRWKFYEDSTVVSMGVKRGFEVFNGKGKCNKCHFGADFTQNDFRNIGLFNGRELNDSGRTLVSGKKEDIGKFKTPSLRNVSVTGPYMHNGMFTTLMQVIDFYSEPDKVIPNSINRDSLLAKPLGLSQAEKSDLEAFLLSLTDEKFNNTVEVQMKYR
ncbi:MAG TPA: cytochrome c peroxidase [Chitinophagaceae bacterium]|nr:cytochrome c peroxidase [Chitinophagaceae bacterium]